MPGLHTLAGFEYFEFEMEEAGKANKMDRENIKILILM